MALTLVDSLDTLWLMGMKEEFQRGVQWLEESFKLDSLQEVSIFDYGTRLLGGLLSAYEISRSEVLLVKAVKVGDLIMKAFDGDLFPSVAVFLSSHVACDRSRDRQNGSQRAGDAGRGGDAGCGAASSLGGDARQAVRDGGGATADGAVPAGDDGRHLPRYDIPKTAATGP